MDTHKSRNDDHPWRHSGAEVALLPHQLDAVRDHGFGPEDVWWERTSGQHELNPLLLARIAERVQYDGDVPELRFGNLPEGGKPAVPVAADTVDPVLLGHMLRCASLDVHEELRGLQTAWENDQVQKQEHLGELARVDAMPIWSVPGYEPGQLPARRNVGVVASDVIHLSAEEKHEAAFLAIASTQGRVSFAPAIRRLLQEGLEARGLTVESRKGEGAPLATAHWTMSISQAKVHNPRFSPAATAAASMLRALLKSLPSDLAACVFHVEPINTIHDREVGWRVAVHA